MIIFGSTSLTSTTDTGTFYCPQCGNQQLYNLRQVRNFFTLYFIPIIPLDIAGRYVQCTNCQGSYEMDILNFDPEAAQAEFHEDLKRIMILMAIADDAVDQDEIDTIQEHYQRMTGKPITPQQIHEEARLAQDSGADMLSYVRTIAPELSEDGIIAVIAVAFEVASAGGDLPPGRQKQLQELPEALNISREDFKAVIEAISESE